MTQIDFHKQFPGSGQGKHYEFHRTQLSSLQKTSKKPIKVLDWGSGQGGTTQWLKAQGFAVWAYDPYYTPLSSVKTLHSDYDAIITGDVLEHIHTEDIPWDYFAGIPNNIHIVDLTPAKKRLPTGENAHINLQTSEEWLETFSVRLGGKLVQNLTYDTPDPNYEWRTRLCVHIKL